MKWNEIKQKVPKNFKIETLMLKNFYYFLFLWILAF